ncbi:hypothetical protein [Candidatus Palauibacter sp.]|uniref:hypothetical protein n=1 Tax=Candidatus Palauibacter sp. TaxID=3101350 RepID=UPI003B028E60
MSKKVARLGDALQHDGHAFAHEVRGFKRVGRVIDHGERGVPVRDVGIEAFELRHAPDGLGQLLGRDRIHCLECPEEVEIDAALEDVAVERAFEEAIGDISHHFQLGAVFRRVFTALLVDLE